MNRIAIKKLRKICADLKLAGEHEMADKVACALSALAGTKEPKPELSYSYIIRELRQKKNQDLRKQFQKVFKEQFDNALDEGLDEPDRVALMATLQQVDVGEV